MKINKAVFQNRWLWRGALVLFGILIYFKVLFFQLTYLDDNVWILDYHWYLKNFSNAWKLFVEPDNFVSGIFYRPLIILSFMTDAAIGGTSLFFYHLTNIIIHITNGLLVLALFHRLGYARRLAYAGAFIFVSHPVLTQAVAWIPGRTDSLLALFALAAFVSYLGFLQQGKKRFIIIHFLSLILALLTKETAVVLPVVFAVYYFAIFRKEQRPVSQRPVFIGWGIVAAAWFILRKIILTDAPKLDTWVAVKSVFENLPALLVYLGKVIFPVNLSVLPILEDSTLVYGVLALLVLVICFFASRKKRLNYVFFGLFWFIIFILPSLVISFLFHEYRVYLPIIGIMIVCLEISGIKRLSLNTKKFGVIMALLIVSYGITAFIYSHRYKEKYAFWESAVETSPHSPLAHRNLGAMYHLDGKLDLAEGEYYKALELNPEERMVNNNLGLIHVRKKEYKKAQQFYLREIAINPTYDNVYFNLGLLYYGARNFPKAVAAWQKAIQLNPRYLAAYKYLLKYYVDTKNTEQVNYYIDQLKKQGVDVSVRK